MQHFNATVRAVVREWNFWVNGSVITTIFLLAATVANLVALGNPSFPIWVLKLLDWAGIAWIAVTLPASAIKFVMAESSARIATENKLASTLPDFHAKCNFVMPMRQMEHGISILANFRLENRGAESEIDDWNLVGNVCGIQQDGIPDGVVAEESHIVVVAAGPLKRGAIRQGAMSATFQDATLETISLRSVTARFRDAFGRTHFAELADAEEIVDHFPRKPEEPK